ncbi:MAG: metallophosphoesterase [Clostridia bacterium]|nr:metallophosphoesterase [Clostridia bacterium]
MKKFVKIALISLLVLVFAVGAFSCEDTPSKSEYVAHTVSVGSDGTFKILQLTDMHFINSTRTDDNVELDFRLRDEWAMTAARDVIERTKPDMIMVTGDSTYNLKKVMPLRPGLNTDNLASFKKFAQFIDSFDIPWAFCFGNHDEEGSLKEMLGGDKVKAKKVLSAYLMSDEIKNCLYVDGPNDINGVGNYVINVLNKDGSVNNALVVFDSGSFFGDEDNIYEYVHADQLEWYEKAIKSIAEHNKTENVSSIVFQHIPFVTYESVLERFIGALAVEGVNWTTVIKADGTGTEYSVEFEGGTITYHGGVYNEGEVCHSYDGEWPIGSGVKYDGGMAEFNKIVELGSTKAVFCGHDHRNTYSITYKGVRLTYGMSIDYSANGLTPAKDNQTIFNDTIQRGGTLITLNKDSSIEVTQVPFTRNLYQEEVARRQAE